MRQYGYTVWACAVLSNHAHLCVREHKDRYETVWTRFGSNSRNELTLRKHIRAEHPVWADRPYSVYLHTPDDIWRTVEYIKNNPMKEGLPPQEYEWVHSYDGWPRKRSEH